MHSRLSQLAQGRAAAVRSWTARRSYGRMTLKPVNTGANKTSQSNKELAASYANRVPVRSDHPLYLYFHQKHSDKTLLGEKQRTDGEFRYVVLQDTQLNQPELLSGRAWRTSELRLKSFEDLHVLWYLALRERNILATQKEEARRLGILALRRFGASTGINTRNRLNVQRTMRRIKIVLNERRRAYEGAIATMTSEREKSMDQVVLSFKLKRLGKLPSFNPKRRWSEQEKVVFELLEARRAARKERKIQRQVQVKVKAKARVQAKSKKENSKTKKEPRKIDPTIIPSTNETMSLTL